MSAERDDPTATFHASMPLIGTLGIEVLLYTPAEVRARLAWSEEPGTADAAVPGGAIMALVDSSGAACGFLNLPEGAQGTTTIESKTDFFRAVRAGCAEAVTRPLHVGRTVIVLDNVVDDRQGLVAPGDPVAAGPHSVSSPVDAAPSGGQNHSGSCPSVSGKK